MMRCADAPLDGEAVMTEVSAWPWCKDNLLRRNLGRWGVVAAVLSLAVSGCSLDGLLKNDELPPDVTDPAITQTPTGARTIYNGAILQLQDAVGGDAKGYSFADFTGLFTDELDQPTQPGAASAADPIDQRALFGGADNAGASVVYGGLHRVRGQAGQAIQLLARYIPEQPALRGHMYAIEAYAEIMLAEAFCSGIPLSTIDYEGDYTFQPGSTTEEVFTHALALLDTAMTLSADSARVVNLIRVAQGRTLLALGQYAAAGAAVAAVPDDETYLLSYNAAQPEQRMNFAFRWSFGPSPSVANLEGMNGLNYRSSGDPRTMTTQVSSNGVTGYKADKYATTGETPIVLASGVEARLIQAEAALQAGDPSWLTILNTLRSGGPVTLPVDTIVDTLGVSGCGNSAPTCGHSPGGDDPLEFGQPTGGFHVPSGYDLASVDTTYPAPTGVGGQGGLCDQRSWYRPCYSGDSMVVYVYVRPEQAGTGPGTGGVAGLAPLDDPDPAAPVGPTNRRVDLVFRERAFWLFLTGHRQGDLRRLVRVYGRREDTVYPTGPYPVIGIFYGSDVSVPVPLAEKVANPLFTGCASTGA